MCVPCVHLLCCSPHRLQLPAMRQDGVSIDSKLRWCPNMNIHLHDVTINVPTLSW